MKLVAPWFVAVAVTAKLPLTAAAAEVTCSVVELVAPGDSERDADK